MLTKNPDTTRDAKKFSFLEFSVNQAFSTSLLAMIHENHRFLNMVKLKDCKMKKLIAALIAGLFATSVFAQAAAPAAAPADAPKAEAAAPKAKKAKKSHKAKKAKKAAPAADAAK